MRFKGVFSSIRWRVTIPYAVIIFVTTLGLTFYISNEVRKARYTDLESRLLAEAWVISNSMLPDLNAPGGPDIDALDGQAWQWAQISGERVTVIGPEGVVLGESHADRREMDNHLYRPEVQAALRAGQGTAVRFSRTLRAQLMYAAVPVRVDDEVKGIVRVALPLERIEANIRQLSRTIVSAGVFTAVFSIALAIYIASRTIKPIQELTHTVDRMAAGDMSARLLPTTRDEVGQLTRAFNHMADQLRDKVVTLAYERSRLSAVLNNMADGVIITDGSGDVVLINPAAESILKVDAETSVGRTFAQVVYHHQLIDLWNQCWQTGEEQAEMVETGPRGTFLQAIITPLLEIEALHFLVILQDLTRIRRLETVRRDFISNISHELRTPLASLSLVVETLRDGAIEEPPAARQFLTHMENELSSLTQMVEELLELSRIESGKVPLDLQPTKLSKLVKKPLKRLRPQADRKDVELSKSLPGDAPLVLADAQRIHQVVANLVHNAIKFTPSGGHITVFAKVGAQAEAMGAAPDEVVVAVTDTGIGIPAEDLPRIFERFYKIDRARAQEGTGLGLAIAKHIVQGHGGRIWVESLEGVGSTFYFTLPLSSGASPRR
jgi:two-component system phosphate regulon sensor histidine kinase PhoR